MSSWNKGRAWTPEERAKISESLRGRTPWNKGKIGLMPVPWNKGKKLSDETRAKIAEARRGKSSWNAGLKWDDETKRKISESQKKRHDKRTKA